MLVAELPGSLAVSMDLTIVQDIERLVAWTIDTTARRNAPRNVSHVGTFGPV